MIPRCWLWSGGTGRHTCELIETVPARMCLISDLEVRTKNQELKQRDTVPRTKRNSQE